MEELRHDLPTLHRPVSTEGQAYQTDEKGQQPIPAPPHQSDSSLSRPNTSNYRLTPGTIPHMLTEKDWQAYRAKKCCDELPALEDFDRSYRELSAHQAYRYPHPGTPKSRKGCIGGSWRHMREVVGCGPGRLMWIDGIITLYDDEESLNKERPWERSAPFTASVSSSTDSSEHPFYYRQPSRSFPLSGKLLQRRADMNSEDRWYASNKPQPLPFAVSPPTMSAPHGKHRGFYSMAQSYT